MGEQHVPWEPWEGRWAGSLECSTVRGGKGGKEREGCSCERLQGVLGVLGLPLTPNPLLLEQARDSSKR